MKVKLLLEKILLQFVVKKYTDTSWGTLVLYRIGNFVIVNAADMRQSNAFSIPSGYRPTIDMGIPLHTYSSGTGYLVVQSNGACLIYNGGYGTGIYYTTESMPN